MHDPLIGGRCTTCSWWAIGGTFSEPAPDGWGHCRYIGHDAHDDALAYPSYDGGYHADLVTSPDFGCVHHDPQEPPT